MSNATSPRVALGPLAIALLVGSGWIAAVENAQADPVVGWGRDDHFQATPPDAVNGASGTATRIAAGFDHSCAIQAGTGKVICWGSNEEGQSAPPDAVNGTTGTASDVSTGYYHSCAIQAGTGIAVCWGGLEGSGPVPPPDNVNGVLGTASAIASGGWHDCAMRSGTGFVNCWGANHENQSTVPVGLNGRGSATKIAAGGNSSCGIQAGTGRVICWGSNGFGQRTPPDAVNGVAGTATHIAVGGTFSCAIQAGTGNVVCWGANNSGQSTPPDAVNGVSGSASELSISNGIHTCAIQSGTGKVFCWGLNDDGQTSPPDAVNGDSVSVTGLATGVFHSLAIASVPPLAPIAKAEQLCVNSMGRSGERVNGQQLRENERCLSDFQRGRLVAPMTIDECMVADRRGRVAKAAARTQRLEAARCDSLDSPPNYAYSSSETVNAAAVEGALALMYAIFGGPPLLDESVATRIEDKYTAQCQYETLRQAGRLESTVLKELNLEKARMLRNETPSTYVPLNQRLQAVLSVLLSNPKISRAQRMLANAVDRKCAALEAPLHAVFAGACGDQSTTLDEFEVCVIAAARCAACSKINAFDDLVLDCDRADDQLDNGSCS